MIVLDTNAVSEVMLATPNPTVQEWFDRQSAEDLWITSVTLAELLYGIERLPDGKRKVGMHEALDRVLIGAFSQRVLAFDELSARQYATLVANRFAIGRPISVQDAQIAAICRLTGAILATRNTKDFEETGVVLINPWVPLSQ